MSKKSAWFLLVILITFVSITGVALKGILGLPDSTNTLPEIIVVAYHYGAGALIMFVTIKVLDLDI